MVVAQVHVANQLLEIQRTQPSGQDYVNMIATVQAQAQAQTQAMAALAKVVGDLEKRIELWETTFLRELVDRLPHGAPLTPTESPDSQPTPQRRKDTSGEALENVFFRIDQGTRNFRGRAAAPNSQIVCFSQGHRPQL